MDNLNRESLNKDIKRRIYHGIVCIILGIITVLIPGGSIGFLAVVMGIFLLANGLIYSFTAIKNNKTNINWKKWLVSGIIQVFFGIIILAQPVEISSATLRVFIIILGAFCILAGITLLVAFIKYKNYPNSFSTSPLSAILLLAIGIISLVSPLGIGYVIMRIIGILVMVVGILLLVFSNRKISKTGDVDE